MDTGTLREPLYPVKLPEALTEEINKIEEESFTYECVHETDYDGKYHVIVEFDTRPMKTYAFFRELLSKTQDRSEDENILDNLLPMIIKKLRIWKMWEEPKNYSLSTSEAILSDRVVYSDSDALEQARDSLERAIEEHQEETVELNLEDNSITISEEMPSISERYVVGYDSYGMRREENS